jgi:hypothetical protein
MVASSAGSAAGSAAVSSNAARDDAVGREDLTGVVDPAVWARVFGSKSASPPPSETRRTLETMAIPGGCAERWNQNHTRSDQLFVVAGLERDRIVLGDLADGRASQPAGGGRRDVLAATARSADVGASRRRSAAALGWRR